MYICGSDWKVGIRTLWLSPSSRDALSTSDISSEFFVRGSADDSGGRGRPNSSSSPVTVAKVGIPDLSQKLIIMLGIYLLG